MASADLHLVIQKETDGEMMTEREKKKRGAEERGCREGRRERGRVLTSCCPGKQLDGLGCSHLRQEDGEQKVERKKIYKKSSVESYNGSVRGYYVVL